MPLKQLRITNVRNLENVQLDLSSSLNIFFGENGSGKTSILESVSLLAHGRSFRTHNYRQCISHGLGELSVFGLILSSDTQSTLGVLRPRSGNSIYKSDGEAVNSASSLAEKVPLLVMDANSFSILDGSSKYRRKMFDWLVFHVKHQFSSLWRDYSKALRQRNSLLKHGKLTREQIVPWSTEAARIGELVTELRKQCFAHYKKAFDRIMDQVDLNGEFNINIEFDQGWPDGLTLESAIADNLDRDIRYGHTTVGAHKSDIKVLVNKQRASEILSRGQQKSVVAALLVAEIEVYRELVGKPCSILIDDLPSELDAARIGQLSRWLKKLETQVFVTAINHQDLAPLFEQFPLKSTTMFHVKRGEVMQK